MKVSTSDSYFYAVRSGLLKFTSGALDISTLWRLHRLRDGVRRMFPSPIRQAAPLLPVHLAQIHAHMDFTKHSHVRDWALFLVCFAGFLRRSEAAALSPSDISFEHNLVKLRLVKSKTSLTPVEVIIAARSDFRFCPVFWLRVWIYSFCSAAPQGSLFGLNKQAIADALRSWVGRIGLDARDFSGHSLRRGGATAAAAAGVADHLIKLHGRWRSDAYLSYIHPRRAELLLVSSFPLF